MVRQIKRWAAAVLCAALCVSAPVAVQAAGIAKVSAPERAVREFIDLVLEEYAGAAVTEDELLEAALDGMSGLLDPYSYYMTAEETARMDASMSGALTGIGAVFGLNENEQPEVMRVLADTPAKEAGILRGDIISVVNGKAVMGLDIADISARITDPAISRVTLTVLRDGRRLSFSMVKRAIPSLTVRAESLANLLGDAYDTAYDRVAYVNVREISETTADDLETALDAALEGGADSLVLDLRQNPGGYLHITLDICDMLVPAGPIFHMVDNRGTAETVASQLTQPPFGCMAVLVDRNSASAAELITAALQDAGAAVIVGETTFGKGTVQNQFALNNGGGFRLTIAEYLRRSGGKVDGVGVTPDVLVEMDPFLYETPNDAALLTALRILLEP